MAEFCQRWHLMGHRCRDCGYLSVPARFYVRDAKGEECSHEEAEVAYLLWLGQSLDWVDPPVKAEVLRNSVTKPPRDETRVTKPPTKGGRPKKHKDDAAKQKAYRERK